MAKETYPLQGATRFRFPHATPSPSVLTLTVLPEGTNLPLSAVTITGTGDNSVACTIDWPDAPVDGTSTLQVVRYIAPLRVTDFVRQEQITPTPLNDEFNNIVEILQDSVARAQDIQDQAQDAADRADASAQDAADSASNAAASAQDAADSASNAAASASDAADSATSAEYWANSARVSALELATFRSRHLKDTETVFEYVAPQACSFPKDLPGAVAYCGELPNPLVGSFYMFIRHNGVNIGKLTFTTASKVGTFTFNNDLNMVAGDRLSFVTQPDRDNNIQDVAITISGEYTWA